MQSLTYVSSATVRLDLPDIEDLATVSRRNNEGAGLTGMLLYAEHHFIQTLEGERAAVDAMFEVIRADSRHHQVELTLYEAVDERAFTDWSLGCAVLTREQVAADPGLNDFFESDSALYRRSRELGRAGVFHRIFRDTAPLRV